MPTLARIPVPCRKTRLAEKLDSLAPSSGLPRRPSFAPKTADPARWHAPPDAAASKPSHILRLALDAQTPCRIPPHRKQIANRSTKRSPAPIPPLGLE